MKIIIGFMAILLPILSPAQSPLIKALSIGDTVPDITITNVYNYHDTVIQFSDLKGKAVILDFWASWCGSCIHGFPKMDSMQNEFQQEMQFILVNPKQSRDDLNKIITVKNRMDSLIGKPFQLPIVIKDSIISSYFNYMSLPHYVWIDKEGIVKAITGSTCVTIENITAFIKDSNIDLPVKTDTTPPPFSGN